MRLSATWFWVGGMVGVAWATACDGSSSVNDVGDLPGSGAGTAGHEDGGFGGTESSGGRGGSVGGTDTGGGTRGGGDGGTGDRGGSGGSTGGSIAGGAGDGGGGTGGTPSCTVVGVAPGGGMGGNPAGGAGGSDGVNECTRGPGCLFANGEDIRGIAADETHVYWVEYGTTDQFLNYSHDGRVRARAFDGSDDRTLVLGLDGPVSLVVTDRHVYVYLDYGDPDGDEASLIRVPIAGGAGELVLDGATNRTVGGGLCESCVAGANDRDYFLMNGDIYSIPTAECVAPEVIVEGEEAQRLAVDDSNVYFATYYWNSTETNEAWSLWRAPTEGGQSEELAQMTLFTMVGFALVGDYVYTQEVFENKSSSEALYPCFLSRAPKADTDKWTRIANLGDRVGPLRMVGERFFAERWDASGQVVVTGVLSEPTDITTLPGGGMRPLTWAPSSAGVAWLDEGRDEIRLTPATGWQTLE